MSEERYILKADEIVAMAGIRKTHFLNGNAKRVNKSLGDVTGLTGLGFHIIEVEPGCETSELHKHYHEDECVYVLEGTATAVIGTKEHMIGPGDFIGYRKGGLAHTILNTGDGLLRLIVVGQRLAHDVGEYPLKGKRIFRNEGLQWALVDKADIEMPPKGTGDK